MTDDQAKVPTVDIRELMRRFGEFVAVDGATFTVDRGKIFGLIGPNGAGKSTLIKMLTTLLPPTSGAATIVGLHRPKVLILDEPTVGLDPGAREAVWDHVLDLRDSFGTTMIVTSHHLDEIDQFCDRIALIDRGRIAAIGKPGELKAKVGPDATLDDVFIRLVGIRSETEAEGGYGDVRRARRAAREHG